MIAESLVLAAGAYLALKVLTEPKDKCTCDTPKVKPLSANELMRREREKWRRR